MNINTIDLNQADGPFGKLSPFYQNLNPTIITDKDSSKEEESPNLLTYVYAGIIIEKVFRKRIFDRDPHHARDDSYSIFTKEVDAIASHTATRVIERLYTENSEELKVLLRTGKRTILYEFPTQMIFANNNMLGKALMAHREKMRRTLRDKLTMQNVASNKRRLNETYTAYNHLSQLAGQGVNLFKRYKNMRVGDIVKETGIRTSANSIDELPAILQRVVSDPKYDGILAELVMATRFNVDEAIGAAKAAVKQAYYNIRLTGSNEEKMAQRNAMEEELRKTGKMNEFENRLLWMFKNGKILSASDRSKLSTSMNSRLDEILKDGDFPLGKSVDDIFKDFKGESSSESSSITMAELEGDGNEGDIWHVEDLPDILFKEMYASLYSVFKIQHDDKSSKLKVGIPIQEAYKLMSGASSINDLERIFQEIKDEYCELIMQKRCEVALRMIYKDPKSEMARLLATVGERRLVLDMPESPNLSAFIVKMMDEIRHSPSFVEKVVPLTRLDYVRNVRRDNMGLKKETTKMADIFKGEELDWILAKIDDVMHGVKRFREYKKRKFETNNVDDEDIKCVLAMYTNCVSCAMDKMTTYRRKKLLSHKDVPSDFSEKYRGYSRKGTTMLWNYALILHNMLTELKETLKSTGLKLSIEKMTKIASILSNKERPDVKMAVLNLLETINSHMTKRLASFEIDKFDVELVYQIISASKEHLREESVGNRTFGNRSFGGTGAGANNREFGQQDVDAIKKYVSRFVSNVSVEEKEMRETKLTKYITAAAHQLSRVEMSRINMFASSSCKKDDEDVLDVVDVDEVDEVEDDLEDALERGGDGDGDGGEEKALGDGGMFSEYLYRQDEDIRNIVFKKNVDDNDGVRENDRESDDENGESDGDNESDNESDEGYDIDDVEVSDE